MSTIVPFHFDTHEVRIQTDAHGDPWWVAKDVCAILDLSNVGEALHRLSPSESTIIIISDHGIPHRLALINEQGLYRLIFRSNKPEAKRFQGWVFGEVLPAIRKTGSYQALPPPVPVPPLLPIPEEVAPRVLAARLEAGNLLGVPLYIAQQEAIKAVRTSTGVDYETLLLSAPAQDNIPEEAKMLEPTDLAAALGWGKQAGARMNKALEAQGWQCKTPAGTWDVTPLGAPHAADHAWTKGPKSGFNLRWNVAAVRRALAP